jgi:hypothetical protein
MRALVKWSMFATATDRRAMPHVDPTPWFTLADRDDLSYAEKLAAYRELADDYFETERYQDFCASRLREVDEVVVEYIESDDFDRVLVETVTSTFPAHEHDQFIAHFRGLLALWAKDERTRLG